MIRQIAPARGLLLCAALFLLFPLAAACAGNGVIDPAAAGRAAPGIILTPPPPPDSCPRNPANAVTDGGAIGKPHTNASRVVKPDGGVRVHCLYAAYGRSVSFLRIAGQRGGALLGA